MTQTTDAISLTWSKSVQHVQHRHSLYELSPLIASAVIKVTMSGSSYLVNTYNSKLQTLLNMVKNATQK
jgi:hypothetical protein